MDRINLGFIHTRAQRTRDIAGEYMALLEEGQSVEDWLSVVESRSSEVARALRDHFAAINRTDRARPSVHDALEKANESLFPSVDRGVIAGKGFGAFQPRKHYPSVSEALVLVRGLDPQCRVSDVDLGRPSRYRKDTILPRLRRPSSETGGALSSTAPRPT